MSAGMSPSDVKTMLIRFAENELTLRYLEYYDMKPPKAGADFAGL